MVESYELEKEKIKEQMRYHEKAEIVLMEKIRKLDQENAVKVIKMYEALPNESIYIIERKISDIEKEEFLQGITIPKEKYTKIMSNLNEGWCIDDALSFGEDINSALKVYKQYSNEFPEKTFRIVKANCIYDDHGISSYDYDYERLAVLPVLDQAEEISISDVKVRIYNSESNELKDGSFYTLDEANVLFERADKEVLKRKQSSVVNKIKEVFLPTYDKIRAMITLPEGDTFGFRYDAGNGYAKNLIDFLDKTFSNEHISNYAKDVLYIGDYILDKDDKCKFIFDIRDGKFECFNVANNDIRVTDIKIESDPGKVIKAGTLYKLDKSDVAFRIGHANNYELYEVFKKIDVFKTRNLVQIANNSPGIIQTNNLSGSLEL